MEKKFKYEFINHFNNMPLYCSVIGINDFSLHWHNDIEVLFVLKGKVCVNLNDSKYIMEKGDILLINPNQAHFFEDIEEENLILLIQFSPEIMNNIGEPGKRNIVFKCNTMTSDITQKEAFTKLRPLLAHIGYEIYTERNGYEYFIISKLYEIIGILHRNFTYEINFDEIKSSENNNLKRLKGIIEYIEDNYAKDISLSNVANSVHMSKSYLSHFLKGAIGISFKTYLDIVRFHKSAELLRTSDYSIMEVAIECGFNNKQPMYRLYKKNINMTPSEYRDKHSNLSKKNITLINNYRIVNPINAIKYFSEYL